ncbi:hypothetical protein [Fimbriimonas ginsengisoli]|uniref:Uncharacterized protein n=1 Tax=Fimbriimonas ginsengisoli Gsoil 348 TaxID=661478 RepID=A0A068NLV9_FIMGI|nr:hypothetical protein [Fimbriimonas ginsengisoli]AIE84402.1 hypothetical protein OP10G_1034 [Fimbriimonas ginsengisoli Gsoil 348]
MNTRSIDTYVSELRQMLERTLSTQYAEEIAAEAKNHLSERAAELRAIGRSAMDAEALAVQEFGELGEIAVELADGYPPKSAMDARRLGPLPEIALGVMLSIAGYGFSIYGGWRGVEAAAGILLPSMPMLMVPGLTAGLGRLKYRRLRPLAILVRMANYGLCLTLVAAACLLGLQLTGRAALTTVLPLEYAFAAAVVVMYSVMRMSSTDGKLYTFLRSRCRIR